MIVSLPAAQRVMEGVGNVFPESDQELIALFKASLVVKSLKIMDVNEQKDVFADITGEIADAVLCQLREIAVIVEAGQ
jgi:hypothetical protein